MRVFVGLNLATLLIYAGLSIVFFLIPFDLIERRALPATDAGLAFLPFTLGVGLLSQVFGGLADKIGARPMLVTGPIGAAFAYAWMALSQEASLLFGVIGPMASSRPIICHFGSAAHGVGHVERRGPRRRARVWHQQCGEPDCAIGRCGIGFGRRGRQIRLRAWARGCGNLLGWRRLYRLDIGTDECGQIGFIMEYRLRFARFRGVYYSGIGCCAWQAQH